MAYLFSTENGSLYEVRDGTVRRFADHPIGHSTPELDEVDSGHIRLVRTPSVVVGEKATLSTRNGPLLTGRVVLRRQIP